LQALRYQIKAGRTMNSVSKALAAALLILAGAPGCGGPAMPPPLEGARIGGPFALTGTDGRTVRDTDFAGKYRLVYFGYTFCPDVCPNDMQKLGATLKLLEKDDPALAAKIAPIFITVDPERDTPAVVKQFVSAFHPRITGLTGSPEAIASAAKSYAIAYRKMEPATPGAGYLVDHIAVIYLMDPAGKPLAALSRDMDPQAMAAEVRRWAK
jgi:protein SCO1/2